MQESSSGTPERRQNPRTKLVEIAYIGMGPENGGLVLDVSDGGLSFHSVAPVQPAEKIEFLLSLRGHSRIEGTGEVVWTNELKTICGLRFTSLSSGAREYINSWTNQSKAPAPARQRTFEPAPKPAPAAAPPPEVYSAKAENEPPRGTGATTAPVFALRPAFDSPLTLPDAESGKLWREPVFLWILFAVLGSAVGVSTYKYGVQVGRSEAIVASRAASAPPAETNPEASAPALATPQPAATAAPAPIPVAVETVPVSAEAPAVPGVARPAPAATLMNTARTEEAANGASQVPAPDQKSIASADRTEQQLQAGQSELAAAQAYLTGANGVRDSAKAARLLWAAVGNGNSDAEVLLADLYIRGDGVTKSCEQGRILLVAAIKSGNIDAQQKLKDLNVRGCQQ